MSATTSLPSSSLPSSGGAHHADVSQEEFLHHMSAMQQQYRAVGPADHASAELYLLPAHLTLAVPPPAAGAAAKREADHRIDEAFDTLAAAGTPAPAARLLAEALHEQHKRTLVFINTHRDAMMQAIAAMRKPNSTQTFTQQMNALRDRIKIEHEAQINAMFARFIAIGTAHPAARPVILNTGNKVGGFVVGIVAEAAHVAGTVKSAVVAGGSAFAKAAETVSHWGSSAAQSVGHFFKSLF